MTNSRSVVGSENTIIARALSLTWHESPNKDALSYEQARDIVLWAGGL